MKRVRMPPRNIMIIIPSRVDSELVTGVRDWRDGEARPAGPPACEVFRGQGLRHVDGRRIDGLPYVTVEENFPFRSHEHIRLCRIYHMPPAAS